MPLIPPARTAPLRRRATAIAALLAAAALAVPLGVPAAAHSAEHDSYRWETARANDSQQSLTVSPDVELAPPALDAEVEAVSPPKPPGWVRPAGGALRDGFGPRPQAPVLGVSGVHRGQDIGAPCGATIRAAAAGRVLQAGWAGTYGNWVLLQHRGGAQTGYAHASRLLVSPGQRVRAGTPIAEAGTTGASSGCHLHLETRVDGAQVDPVAFLLSRKVRLRG